jgi:predicted nucleic acid-binding protein
MKIIIDANIITCCCNNCVCCCSILTKAKKHKVVYNTEIVKEYEAMERKNICKNSNNKQFVHEWVIEITSKYGKKINQSIATPGCIEKLNRKSKFPNKDIPYVKAGIISGAHIIISQDYHFLHHAKSCIESLGIKVFDAKEGNTKL